MQRFTQEKFSTGKAKRTINRENQKLEAIDGPPVDFSFRNIRKLEQMEQLANKNSSTIKPLQQQEKPKEVVSKPTLSSFMLNEDQLPEIVEPKLQIVRTIEILDSRLPDPRKQNIAKKTQNYHKKNKVVVQLKTTSLFLRYNKLVSIDNLKIQLEKVFPSINQLIWLDLSHNRLTKLVSDFQEFPQLKNLYLHANYISNFKQLEKLKPVHYLRTLTIHANPLENYGEFRIIISAILPQVQKLDSTLITKRQKERAEVVMKSMKKFPVIKDPQQPPADSDVEEEN